MTNTLLHNFYFYKSERRGVLILLCLVTILLSSQICLPYIFPNNNIEVEIHAVLTTYVDSIKTEEKNLQKPKIAQSSFRSGRQISRPSTYFHFNPNTISKDSLRMLGLSSFAVNNWIKFREASGGFRSMDQIRKIYGLAQHQLDSLLIYAQLNNSVAGHKPRSKELTIDINLANAEELSQLYGIGPVLSKRIVKFRDALGGFYSVNQLRDVYGLQDSVYLTIKPRLIIGQNHIKMNINMVSKNTLIKHPYISFKEADLIVKYKYQHGAFENISELYQINAFDSSYVNRVRPYFEVALK